MMTVTVCMEKINQEWCSPSLIKNSLIISLRLVYVPMVRPANPIKTIIKFLNTMIALDTPVVSL